jgi:hypothetical protein
LAGEYLYNRKLSPHEVRVDFAFEEWTRDAENTLYEARLVGERFGFDVCRASLSERLPERDGYLLVHLIVDSKRPYDDAIVQSVIRLLGKSYDSASIAFSYDSTDSMIRVSSVIEDVKRRMGDCINFIRPDEIAGHRWVVSRRKLLENSVSDTVRIKYRPLQVAGTLDEDVLESIWYYFEQASRIYSRRCLYHRWPSDGYFAARVDGGFAITATKTNKISLPKERISLVHEYHEHTNTLVYSGAYLPSSDAVEAAIVFGECETLNALAHTHASTMFTRNKIFAHKVKVGRLPYGEPALGHILSATLANSDDNFVIMEDHGEVFGNPSSAQASELVNAIESHCRAATTHASDT